MSRWCRRPEQAHRRGAVHGYPIKRRCWTSTPSAPAAARSPASMAAAAQGRPAQRRRRSGAGLLRRGGRVPTVTDANVVLQTLNPEHLLGGGAVPVADVGVDVRPQRRVRGPSERLALHACHATPRHASTSPDRGWPAGRVSRADFPPDRHPAPASAPCRPHHATDRSGEPRQEEPSLYLKSLTLKGFKSFASVDDAAARARASPASSGPNGSGKSNVVDALAWVMGEQGAKSLRGGKMEDVIFAGTSGRPPLGPRRGAAHHRQLRRRAADRVRRGHDQPHDVPQRRLGVRHQRHALPAARRPGAAQRLRHRPRDARDRRAGPARHDPARHPRGPARLHRGGRRRPQAPQAQGEGAPQARLAPTAT